jgi:hypothetical protein
MHVLLDRGRLEVPQPSGKSVLLDRHGRPFNEENVPLVGHTKRGVPVPEIRGGTLWTPPVYFSAFTSNCLPNTAGMGTIITANSTINTKGTTPTTLIASIGFDARYVTVKMGDARTATTNSAVLQDVMIGAAASESVLIPNLNAGSSDPSGPSGSGVNAGGQEYRMPLYVPSGSRLSARSQAATASRTHKCQIRCWGEPSAPVWAGHVVTDYGTATASSKGVAVTPGLNAVEGTFTQIVASTTDDIRYLSVGCGLNGLAVAATAAAMLVDVGIGAATEQVILQDDSYVVLGTAPSIWHMAIGGYVNIPSGARLAARASQGLASPAQVIDVIIYGVT